MSFPIETLREKEVFKFCFVTLDNGLSEIESEKGRKREKKKKKKKRKSIRR